MAVYDSGGDHKTLDDLFGKALLYDELRAALLQRDTRPHVLRAFRLSRAAQQYLVSLPDMPDLSDLAQNIYDGFLR
ncbi:MAG: hypothetical protein JXJ17_18885 [Anaerolineae bacterium]|nr:hypothetical protein [Anaerolineae bacterium]